ncbi:MAG TPA: 16S rRNA (guanine(527)-N(7))-methyltransferase RsmG [Chloroflexia bacterium]|nr:16S rRNA (guanine(527)-N(7))-methyltransferase RsmG [Chloroflexia bacterium]
MMDLLAAGATALGLPLTPGQLAQFEAYYRMLVDWNTRVNLTAIVDPVGVQLRHFVDSLAVAAALLRVAGGPGRAGALPPIFTRGRGLIDLGTGGGFPGLPLKILWPALPLTLVDSVGKKTAFLQAAAAALGMAGVTVLTGRAEALGQTQGHRAAYDVATARAVAALPVLAEYGLPLCRVGGLVLASKKGDLAAELAQARKVLPQLGGGALSLYHYRLAAADEDRLVVGLPKVAPTPDGYPRRVGLPAKQPLGI